jgi:hypothetical protein
MKTAIKYLIVISLLIITVYGCKKNKTPEPIPDTTKPSLSIAQPTAGQEFVPGNTIPFHATFTDNDMLKSYDISISKVLATGFLLKNVPTPVPWTYTKSSTNFTTGVKQQEVTLSDIVIPMDISGSPVATGNYNFTVNCIDGSNNSTSTTIIFKIK